MASEKLSYWNCTNLSHKEKRKKKTKQAFTQNEKLLSLSACDNLCEFPLKDKKPFSQLLIFNSSTFQANHNLDQVYIF